MHFYDGQCGSRIHAIGPVEKKDTFLGDLLALEVRLGHFIRGPFA